MVNTASSFASDIELYIADETLPLAVRQLVAYQFGDPLEHCVSFRRASVPHDFGTYYELRIYFQEWDNNYMSKIDEDFPKYWDAEALEFLKQNNYFRGAND